jgi:hypothetical protein
MWGVLDWEKARVKYIIKSLRLLVIGLIVSFGLQQSPSSASLVSVQNASADGAGENIVQEVGKEISKSSSLKFGQNEDKGWKIIILSSDFQSFYVYSAILIRKKFDSLFDEYVFSFSGKCDIDSSNYCAKEIVHKIQEPIDQFRRDWKEFSSPDVGPK